MNAAFTFAAFAARADRMAACARDERREDERDERREDERDERS